ncbi:hypothetical protein D3C81_1522620 [compost metagenome]
MQNRASESHAYDERQAVIAHAKRTDLLLPLFQCPRLSDRRKLGTGFVEVQIFGAVTDLPIWQQVGIPVPAQTSDQASTLSTVIALQVAL